MIPESGYLDNHSYFFPFSFNLGWRSTLGVATRAPLVQVVSLEGLELQLRASDRLQNLQLQVSEA